MAKNKQSPYPLHPLSLQFPHPKSGDHSWNGLKAGQTAAPAVTSPRPQNSARVDRHWRRRPPRLHPPTNFPAPAPAPPAPAPAVSGAAAPPRRIPPSPPGSLEAAHLRRAQQQQEEAEGRVARAHVVVARGYRPRFCLPSTATRAPPHWLGGFGTGA